MMKFTGLTIVVFIWLLSTPLYGQPEEGIASYYADKFEGRPTASGERYTHKAFTAAHRSLPFGTVLRVVNLENQKEVVVTVNDRGPFVKNRVLDLSKSAAQHLGFVIQGTTMVRYEVITPGISRSFYTSDKQPFRPTGWGLQVASFSQRSNAFLFAQQMGTSHGLSFFLEEAIVENIPFFRVFAGPFNSEESASEVKERINESFKGVFVKALESE